MRFEDLVKNISVVSKKDIKNTNKQCEKEILNLYEILINGVQENLKVTNVDEDLKTMYKTLYCTSTVSSPRYDFLSYFDMKYDFQSYLPINDLGKILNGFAYKLTKRILKSGIDDIKELSIKPIFDNLYLNKKEPEVFFNKIEVEMKLVIYPK
ncbi:MAG TPA: hypothetical protein PK507_02365 [bacterium]|nr:hypothetical protein [bacterium]